MKVWLSRCEVVDGFLADYAGGAPERAKSVFAQHQAIHEGQCGLICPLPTISQHKELEDTCDEQARPKVVHTEIEGKGVTCRVKRKPKELSPQPRQNFYYRRPDKDCDDP